MDTKSLRHLFSSRTLRDESSHSGTTEIWRLLYLFFPTPQIIFVWLLLLRFMASAAVEFKRRALLASFLFTPSVAVVYNLFLFPPLLDFSA